MPGDSHLATIYNPINGIYYKIECKLVGHGNQRTGRRNPTGPFVDYIAKGKSKTQTYSGNDFVILDGVGHPDPPSGWIEIERGGANANAAPGKDRNAIPVTQSKFHLFDPRFRIEFNEFINKLYEYFIADYRSDKSTVLSAEEEEYIAKGERPAEGVAQPSPVPPDIEPEPPEAATVTIFDPSGLADERQYTIAPLVQRSGQTQFRDAILAAYAGRCVVTGCNVQQALEAAHIVPYCGIQSDHVTNGLLLRLDLHRLFDAYLISFDPSSMTLRLGPALVGGYYGFLDGKPLRPPRHHEHAPNLQAIGRHFDEFSRRA
jgi:hypothetical protein